MEMEFVSLKSQKPLFLACQIFGVLPCDRNLQFSRFGEFYSLVVNLLACGWICYIKTSLEFWDSKRAKENFIVELMITIREFSDFLVIGAHACSLLLRRNTLQKVITGIRFLEMPNVSGKIQRKIFYVIFIICYLIIMSIAIKLCPPLYFHSQVNRVEIELAYIISFLAAASFSAFIDYLRSHLEHMTETLQPNGKALGLRLDLTLFILDLSRSLNKFYSMQIFLLCSRILMNLILSGYFVIDYLRTKTFYTPSDVVWLNYLAWIALLVALAGDLSGLIFICSSCSNFQNAVSLR